MSNKNTYLDIIQEKLLFWFTRPTLLVLILVLTGVLAFSMIYYGWGLTPTTQRMVQEKPIPANIQVSIEEVNKAIDDGKPKPILKNPIQKESIPVEEKPAVDELEIALNKVMDSLKILLPDSLYPWETNSFFDYSTYSWVTKSRGVLFYLKSISSNAVDKKHYIGGLNGLCGVLVQFKLDSRKSPLEGYTQVWNNKSDSRLQTINENKDWFRTENLFTELEFATTIGHKKYALRESEVWLREVLYPISILAIFLVLLSIRKSLNKDN